MDDECHLECVIHDVRSDSKYGQRLIARALVACGRVFDPGACRASFSFPFVSFCTSRRVRLHSSR